MHRICIQFKQCSACYMIFFNTNLNILWLRKVIPDKHFQYILKLYATVYINLVVKEKNISCIKTALHAGMFAGEDYWFLFVLFFLAERGVFNFIQNIHEKIKV